MDEIRRILKQRPPFLMVDRIISKHPKRVTSQKFISENDYFLSGHFPGRPILPGTLEIEFVAQTSMFLDLGLGTVENGYLTKIKSFSFYNVVVPGSILTATAQLKRQFGNYVVTECTINDNKNNKIAKGTLEFYIK